VPINNELTPKQLVRQVIRECRPLIANLEKPHQPHPVLYRAMRRIRAKARKLNERNWSDDIVKRLEKSLKTKFGRSTSWFRRLLKAGSTMGSRRISKFALATAYADWREWSDDRFELELFRRGIERLARKHSKIPGSRRRAKRHRSP
jgi:hypothetical protein